MKLRTSIVFALLLAFATQVACGGLPQTPEETASPSSKAVDEKSRWSKGTASYYADSFEGKATASGEPYRSKKLTAAHRTLPFGTKVLVERIDNGKSVVVTINDRGPFVKGRIIDLSFQAAKLLSMQTSGTAEVRITKVQ